MLAKILIEIFIANTISPGVFATTTTPKELGSINRFHLFMQQSSDGIVINRDIPQAMFLENIDFCKVHQRETSYFNNFPSMWIWEVMSWHQFRSVITTITSCYRTLSNLTRSQAFHLVTFYNTNTTEETLVDSETNLSQILRQNSELFLCRLIQTGHLNECTEIFFMKKRIYYQSLQFPTSLLSFYDQLHFLSFKGYVFNEKFKPVSVSDSDSHVLLSGGINVEIYRYLRDSLNFSESAIQVNRGLRESPNGTLNNTGLAKVLNSGIADISIPVFEYIMYRISGPYRIQFLHPIVMSRKAIAIFVQPPKSDVRNVYGRPYSTNIWIFAAALHLLEMLSFFIILRIYFKLTNTPTTSLNTFRSVNMWVFSLNTRQGDLGADSPPEVTSVRLALFFGALCSTIMHAIYSSKLTSILAVDDDPITKIQQLFDARYGIYVNTNVPSLKQLAVTNLHRSKYTIDPSSLAIDPTLGVARVVSSRSALLTATDEFAYVYSQGQYTRDYLCSCLSTIQLSEIAIKSAQFVKHGSPLRNIFNVK
ncbi:unnamed protein product [Orchesella dallaii]|uniref:Ionotropic glutamate receptor C-terminal domain-containing protein n=1 Tax=Orchesella dallaii TaxID=48710 RepID=A0ABP1RDD5_9HEXA